MTTWMVDHDCKIIAWSLANRTLVLIATAAVVGGGIMAMLVLGSWLVTRRLSTRTGISRWQNLLEVVVSTIRDQIRDVGQQDPGPYLAFVGTLFVFIAVSNVLAIVPGYHPPTGSLSTTAALALCVFVAVPLYGIARSLVRGVSAEAFEEQIQENTKLIFIKLVLLTYKNYLFATIR